MLLTFLSLQAVAPSTDPATEYLSDRCRAATPREDEVVVCGRRGGPSPYRIGPQAPAAPTLPDARFKISEGAEANLSAEQGEIGGIPTNRAMITFKFKF